MILRLPTQKDELLAINEAFYRLSRLGDFNQFISWLKKEDFRLSKENVRTEGTQVLWNQGCLQALSDLSTYLDPDEAAKIIEKLKK